MRKPRDIDAELRALAEKAKGLKARKVVQLGGLVIATGAETLDAEVIAGALLAAVETTHAGEKEAWRRRGAAFFQQQGTQSRSRKTSAGGAAGDGAG